jgi:hypothetical protein
MRHPNKRATPKQEVTGEFLEKFQEFPLMRHPNKRATTGAGKSTQVPQYLAFPLMRHPNKRATGGILVIRLKHMKNRIHHLFPLMRHPNKRATIPTCLSIFTDAVILFPLMRHPNKRAT